MRRHARKLILALALSAALPGAANATAPQPVVLGVNTAGIPQTMGSALDTFAAKAGAMPQIAMYYQDWYEGWSTALVNPNFVSQATARGVTPMITWEPCLDTAGTIDQPAYAPRNIARGDFDPYIHRAAREAKAFGQPFFVRLAHEMNGGWSTWGRGVNGNTPADYIAMWRHVVGIFREEGADNVRWVWSPNIGGWNGVAWFQDYYPGDDWVDWVALDGYNWGSTMASGWHSFTSVFADNYDALVHLAPTKPVMIGETASAEAGGDKAAWITQGLGHDLQARMPRVRALIWFDRDKETDWRVDSSSASEDALRSVVSSGVLSGTAASLWQTPDPPADDPPVIDPPVIDRPIVAPPVVDPPAATSPATPGPTPPTAPAPPAAAPGFSAAYFVSGRLAQLARTRTDRAIAFNWGHGTPDPSIRRHPFSVRWTGALSASSRGAYRFRARVSGGVRVWVGGRRVIRSWRVRGTRTVSGRVKLAAGRSYPVRVEYRSGRGRALVTVRWGRSGRHAALLAP